jgi:hypothetical protein
MVAGIRKHWQLIALGALLAGLVNGIFQAVDGRARYHPLVEFAGGVVSGPLYFAIATAILLSTVYSGTAFAERIHARPGLHPSAEPGDGLVGVATVGILLSLVWAISVFWGVQALANIHTSLHQRGRCSMVYD